MIATVINYCTYDYRYLPFAIAQAKLFSDRVIVVCADHFFDGTKENRHLLSHSYQAHPDVDFIEFAFDKGEPYGLYPRKRDEDLEGVQYWHSTSRYIGYHYLPKDYEYVLFLDTDEIPDGKAIKEWLSKGEYKFYDAIRFVCYFYFRQPGQRATKLTRCGLLVRTEGLQSEILLDVHERRGTFLSIKGDRLEDARGENGEILFHHYSWVRTREEAKKKVTTWGHKNDRFWEKDIEREFVGEGKKEEIFHLNYEMVDPFCDPFSIEMPTEQVKATLSNVILTTPKEVFKRSVKRLCDHT